MTQYQALLFPVTAPQASETWPLALIFDRLVHYRLPGSPAYGQGESSGFYFGREPVGLSVEDQARFRALVKELAGNEAEFSGGLLASFAVGRADRQEASVQALAASLRSGQGTPKPELSVQQALWQGMLVLKLAEMLREKEREISRELMRISRREAGLFAAIRGEDEELDEEEAVAMRELGAAAEPGASAIRPEMPARAWGRLYLADPEAAAIPILAAIGTEAAALLAGACESLTGQAPLELARLVLPGLAGDDVELATVKSFRAESVSLREEFIRALIEAAAGDPLAGPAKKLEEMLSPLTRKAKATKTLRFYACPGLSLSALVAGLTGENPPPPSFPATAVYAAMA